MLPLQITSIAVVMLTAFAIPVAEAFGKGAPAGVCSKDPQKAVKQPHHGKAVAQAGKSPYTIRASGSQYAAGQTIQVTIAGPQAATFRGFVVQAHDRKTGQPVGKFLAAANTNLLPDCASITHADPMDKTAALLVWQAPEHRGGKVYFTGIIVQDFNTFWTGIRASVQAH